VKAREPKGAALALDEAAARLDAQRFSHAAMATVFEVICVHDDASYAAQGAQDAFDLVDRLELELSRFIANSDVSRINTLAAGETARVSPSTIVCLEIARRMHALTGGVFDISIGSGLERLELAPDERVVRARDDGIRLDLGGIGKGYAIDRMAELLEDWDIRCVLIHGGFSSVLAREAPPGRDGWPLTLTAPGPGTDRPRTRISARHLALSASGSRKGDHVLDPLAGRAVRDRAAWAVLSCPPGPKEGRASVDWRDAARWPATVAEALSTAFMILPVHEIAELCRRGPGLEAWLVRDARGEGEPRDGLVHVAPAQARGGERSAFA
jgi:thiamine biosynthesis lipoprotein